MCQPADSLSAGFFVSAGIFVATLGSSDMRTIRKYANRRLYDVETSHYITLEDLKDLIAAGEQVEVVDAKSKANITRDVLLQLVAEQEQVGQPILSEALLTSMIQFYGHPMQKLASQYLEMSLQQLQSQRTKLRESFRQTLDAPGEIMSSMAEQNLEWMSQMQNTFLNALNPRRKPDQKSDDPNSGKTNGKTEDEQ
jgi:polyhydroxyalkanoate synthesis repressor PhaR